MRSHLFFATSLPFAVSQLLSRSEDPIPGRYIVTFNENLSESEIQDHFQWVAGLQRKRGLSGANSGEGIAKAFSVGSFHAYSGYFDKQMLGEIGANSEAIVRIEPDVPVYPYDIVTQKSATWGLGAISHAQSIDPDADLRDGFEYVYDSSAGEGTYAYVIDSGVKVDLPEFEGRAVLGHNVFPEEPFEDQSGHGTHVAGTLASKTWGVAKRANIVAVKVLAPNRGVMSDFMAGFEWAVANITGTPGRAAKSVINMSLGGPSNWAFNAMVDAASEQGVLSVVSAGNAAVDVSRVTPAGAVSALTVAASAANNTALEWSNYGALVDIYAPGVDVYSLSRTEGESEAKSGTSMASPHVAGLALYLKSLGDGLDSVEATTNKILELARRDVLKEVSSSTVNLFTFNGLRAANETA